MPLFKHKEKNRPDVTNQQPATAPPNQPQHQHNNSYHDSAYYSNSNASTMDSRVQQPQQNQNHEGQRPGTTVTTTTTTTTSKYFQTSHSKQPTSIDCRLTELYPATTTVAPDGTTQTHSHPYNPSTDPPPQASETIVDQRLPSNQDIVPNTNTNPNSNTQPTPKMTSYEREQTRPNPTITQQAPTPSHSYREAPPRKPTPQQLQQSQFAPPPRAAPVPPQNAAARTEAELSAIPRSLSTTGGRPIPPRSEFLNTTNARGTSPNPAPTLDPDTAGIPPPPARSPKRNSGDGVVAPLNTNRSAGDTDAVESSVSPTAPARSHTPDFSHPSAVAASPSSPTRANFGTTTSISADGPSQPHGKRESLFGAIKGLHGAGEALRGTVNGTIAKASHDTVEEERMRTIREKGMGEWRASGLSERAGGLREGFREKAGERQKNRRLSVGKGVHGSEGPGGLGPVEELER